MNFVTSCHKSTQIMLPFTRCQITAPFLKVLSAMSLEKPLRLDGEALVLCRGLDGVAGWVLHN